MPMKWTNTKPTEPGWYWVKATRDGKSHRDPEIRLFEKTSEGLEPYGGPYSTFGWDWFSGPIPIPKGDTPDFPMHDPASEAVER